MWKFLRSIFPNLLQDFPHFRFFEFFIAHSLILFSVFYFLFIKKYLITLRDMVVAYLITIGYLLLIFITNFLLGSNYLYLTKKPIFNSFLDFFGDYYQL